MLELMRARMQRLALRNAPAVYAVDLLLPEEGARELRLRYSYVTRKERRSLLSIADAARSPVATRRVVLEGEQTTKVHGGWSVPIPASPARHCFDLFAAWEEADSPLEFPAGVPRALRDHSEPRDLVRMTTAGLRSGALVTGVTDDPSREGWTACTVTLTEMPTAPSVAFGRSTGQFVGAGWESPSRRSLASGMILRAMQRLEGQFDLTPAATLRVKFGDRHAALLSPSASTVILEPSWVEAQVPALEAEAFLTWQLSALWWGGVARVEGKNATKLLFALRLHSLACSENREGADSDGNLSRFELIIRVFETLCAKLDTEREREWYRHVVELARRVRAWSEREPSNQVALREVQRDLGGKEVDVAWIAKRLGPAGLDLSL